MKMLLMSRYYATSKDMREVPSPKFIKDAGFVIQFNPNIKMFRLNSKEDLPSELMGYTPHKKALISGVAKYLKTSR